MVLSLYRKGDSVKMNYLDQFNADETVCFTGHRPERLPVDAGEQLRMMDRLGDAIEAAIQRGKVNFVSGCMSGWDTLAAEQVIRLREKYPQIQCILILPFENDYFNNKNWTPAWEARFMEVFKEADYKTSLSVKAYRGIYFERDRVIVDMSSEVIAYYDGGAGGTKYTIEYAVKKHLTVSNIAEYKSHAFLPKHITEQIGKPLMDSMGEVYEDTMYHLIRLQISIDSHIQWGENVHALIISDRCGGRAVGLYEYLTGKTNLASVRIRDNPQAIQEAAQSCAPQIIVFVGYQKCKANYEILKTIWKQPHFAVMYASLDFIIDRECQRFGIQEMFHCLNPLADFVKVLQRAQNCAR